MSDTIYALSSGSLPSGVAVVRVSGPKVRFVIETICESPPEPNGVSLKRIIEPTANTVIDEALVLRFFAPASFTGEDVVEFHLHGGLAVVNALLTILSTIEGLRLAEPGEFTYRAFENGKIDLTRAEAIGDLINAETEAQRMIAMDHVAGNAGEIYQDWAQRLVSARGFIEAEIDFVDEDDVPGSVSDQVWKDMEVLANELRLHLDRYGVAKIIQSGLRVALVGRPNAGKSSLLNYLAGQDIAIVTSEPGTTRDVLDVKIDLDGFAVVLSDTAGIRETDGLVEQEGIRRARKAAAEADLVLLLVDGFSEDEAELDIVHDHRIVTKSDLIPKYDTDSSICISSKTGEGIEALLNLIRQRIDCDTNFGTGLDNNTFIVARERQRNLLYDALSHIEQSILMRSEPLELRAEELRNAAVSIGKITGQSDVEDLLGVVFSKFCVGK